MDFMLEKLDQKYCVSETNEDGTVKTYLYKSRNVTTSHVHMILSHALTKMIDNAECFIYLNTSNSTTHQDDTSIWTLSPWLFHELAMVEIIEEKSLSRLFLRAARVTVKIIAHTVLPLITLLIPID